VLHASYITVDDMVATLRHFLPPDEAAVAELRPQLKTLRGRPSFFFDGFLTSLRFNLSRRLAAAAADADSPLNAAAVRRLWMDAAAAGVVSVRKRVTHVVADLRDAGWPAAPSRGALLCSQLRRASSCHAVPLLSTSLRQPSCQATAWRCLLVGQTSTSWLLMSLRRS
jgi:hypothetical protein